MSISIPHYSANQVYHREVQHSARKICQCSRRQPKSCQLARNENTYRCGKEISFTDRMTQFYDFPLQLEDFQKQELHGSQDQVAVAGSEIKPFLSQYTYYRLVIWVHSLALFY
ncbi:PREDICTED: uncharacterized protein LOC106113716 [Papilio xuthus]|uniref:Uncharacterized protein LOC106113716 n=1 Tax=Papilio xuthus TaxID=66420 RepID=A0AAJ6YZH9_PAPXU|nr:PREDICTED: uncharacterized protein LOC106113716 [Papilio xuthus]